MNKINFTYKSLKEKSKQIPVFFPTSDIYHSQHNPLFLICLESVVWILPKREKRGSRTAAKIKKFGSTAITSSIIRTF